MNRLICRLFGQARHKLAALRCRVFRHAKVHHHDDHHFDEAGVLHYKCRRCECWTANEVRE